MIKNTNPAKKPILIHFLALSLACCASLNCPCANSELTFEALIMPTIPKGRQQNSATRIDSVIQVLGQMFVSIVLDFKC